MKKSNETALVKAVVEYLNASGRFLAWRNNTGAFAGEYKGKRRFVRFGIPGASDVFAVERRNGRFWAIECKMPGEKPSAKQEEFSRTIAGANGGAIWVTSLDEMIEFFSRIAAL